LQDRVLLRGSYSIEEIFDVYSQIDVAVMATLVSEPFGRVIQEAASVGCPAIAPRVGGITEQIRSGVDGLLYTFRDPKDLEAQMRRVLTEPDLLPRLIGNLPEVKDTRVLAVAVEDFYFDILKNTQSQPQDVSYVSLNAVATYSSNSE
jgi:glycosyltransferase involved in cell wall biosynthesis